MREPDWFVEGAAGNVSTVNDMARWLMLQLGGGTYEGVRLLGSEGMKTMHSVPTNVDSSYGMGWVKDGTNIGHNGILWTYYADQLLMQDSGYGVVVLFNSGLNALINYASFTAGISEILQGEEPQHSLVSVQGIEIGIACLTLVTIGLGIRGFFRLSKWEQQYRKRARWLSWLLLLLTLVPPLLFVCLPQILTFIGGGRVLKWEQIFILMPSIFIWLMLISLVCTVHVITRIVRMYRVYKGTGAAGFKV